MDSPAMPQSTASIDSMSAELGSSTWSSRNPAKAVITPRRPKQRASGARKATNSQKCKQRKEASEALESHLSAYAEAEQKFIKEASVSYGYTQDYIARLMHGHTKYKKGRSASWQNAMIHHKSIQVNQGVCISGSINFNTYYVIYRAQ